MRNVKERRERRDMIRLSGMMCEWSRAIVLFVMASVALGLFATLLHINGSHLSGSPHYVVQARAWLHGSLDLPPTLRHDVIFIDGRRVMVYPPGPVLLMLPFVAVLGNGFSDVWFTWLVAALNVALVYHLLQALAARGLSRRSWRENLVLAATFGVGTIALWMALGGDVWFTEQTLAVTCVLGVVIGSIERRWWLASLSLGWALLTRSPDVLAGMLPLAVLAHDSGMRFLPCRSLLPIVARWPSWQTWMQLIVPLAAAAAVWMVHNQLTFGSPLASGYAEQIQQGYPQIKDGLLSWHYVWPNVIVDFLSVPSFNFAQPFDVSPQIDWLRGGNGTSIFFTTPLFLIFFLRDRAWGRDTWLRISLWLSMALLLAFALLWNGTGWYQVGARYLFDLYPFLFALLAMRDDRLGAGLMALAGIGALVNIKLAEVFWCDNGACLGPPDSLHRLAFAAILIGTGIAYVVAGWWLRRSYAGADLTETAPRPSVAGRRSMSWSGTSARAGDAIPVEPARPPVPDASPANGPWRG
jgi:hypothetical protein